MNIYARFFDHDTLVGSVEELVSFLSAIPDITLTNELVDDIRAYVAGDMPYPKRYKIRPRVYFILIKTTAATMEEFKANRKEKAPAVPEGEPMNPKEIKTSLLQENRFGWYRGSITFKRVMLIPGTGKFQYQDTRFEAVTVAESGLDCYNRIVGYLKERSDVDMRSQFPSAKGANFSFQYIGEELTPASDSAGKDNARSTDGKGGAEMKETPREKAVEA